MYYEKAIVSGDENAAHNELCYAGVARISCRLVDLSKGISLALKLGNKVKKECAAILENLKVCSQSLDSSTRIRSMFYSCRFLLEFHLLLIWIAIPRGCDALRIGAPVRQGGLRLHQN